MQCQAKSSGGRHSAPSHREPQRQYRASLRVREQENLHRALIIQALPAHHRHGLEQPAGSPLTKK